MCKDSRPGGCHCQPLRRDQSGVGELANEGRRRWRDISSKPKREILATNAVRDHVQAVRQRFFNFTLMTTRCPVDKVDNNKHLLSGTQTQLVRFLSAASRFVWICVSSISPPLVARAD